MLYQAIDICDRYVEYLEDNKLTASMDPKKIDLHFCVCLYIAVKYFIVLEVPLSYDDLVKGPFRDPNNMREAENFEKVLIREVLKYKIYRPTLYEAADKFNIYLNDVQKAHLYTLQSYIKEILLEKSVQNNVYTVEPSVLTEVCLQYPDKIQGWLDIKQLEIEEEERKKKENIVGSVPVPVVTGMIGKVK